MIRLLVIILFIHISEVTLAQSEDKTLLDLSRKKFEWLIGGRQDSLERVLDEKVQYIHSNGWIQNKKEMLDDMRSGKLVYKKVTIKESSVRIYGETAIVTGLGTFEGTNAGANFLLEMRYTEVYIRKAKQWLLASRHSNRMP